MTAVWDIDLRILKTGLDEYQVTAESQGKGRAGPEMLDWDLLTKGSLTSQLEKIRVEPYAVSKTSIREVGNLLFSALFRGEVLRLFTGIYDHEVQPLTDASLRIRLDIDEGAIEVASIPWEFLQWRDVPLATQVQTLVTRQLLSLEYGSIQSLYVEDKPNVLIIIPQGSNLNTSTEEAIIKEALSRAEIPYKVLKDKVTIHRLNDELATNEYHVLHFIGHGDVDTNDDGTVDNVLRFNSSRGEEDVRDDEEWIGHQRIQALLGNHPSIKLVVLNACKGAVLESNNIVDSRMSFIGLAPAILKTGVPAVVAMQYDIRDDIAVLFAETFYKRLVSGRWAGRVDMAVTLARNACYLEYPYDRGFATPVLYMRSHDGRIIDLDGDGQKHRTARVFISYKRGAVPDESLAMQLCSELLEVDHEVFIDKKLRVGVDWAQEIERQIKACDYLVVLLSQASAQSEMVAKEIEYAYTNHQHTGKSRILPIRVNYPDAIPYQLSHYLGRLQYAEWHRETDTELLINNLVDAISSSEDLSPQGPKFQQQSEEITIPQAPKPYADPRFVESLSEPGGAVRLRSEFYIDRDGDKRMHRELVKPHGTTTTIRAPRQSGKSSLLIRGISQARQQGSRVVLFDLQPLDASYLGSLDSFLHYVAANIVTKLRLNPVEVERAWKGLLGPSDKLTALMEEYVLTEVDDNIVLAIDEADRLLGTPFQSSFFGLLRFWHNSRANNELWEKVDIIMVISTEPHLLIQNVDQSPFNVGLKIRLQDFDRDQLADLNRRYRSPLKEQELDSFRNLLGGHPYLSRKALHTLISEEMTWQELIRVAASDQSPFGDHLRRYLWLLRDSEELRNALSLLFRNIRCSDSVLLYRLAQAGLITGTDTDSCQFRCELYENFLRDKLQ